MRTVHKVTNITDCPIEVLFCILNLLDIKSYFALACISKFFHRLHELYFFDPELIANKTKLVSFFTPIVASIDTKKILQEQNWIHCQFETYRKLYRSKENLWDDLKEDTRVAGCYEVKLAFQNLINNKHMRFFCRNPKRYAFAVAFKKEQIVAYIDKEKKQEYKNIFYRG